MARLRLFPHRTADRAAIELGQWWIERDGVRSTLPDVLKGWDYASAETVGVSATIGTGSVLRSTGLDDSSAIDLLLLADCRHTQQRITARHNLAGHTQDRDAAFDLHLPAGVLAGSVNLSAHLVLARTTAARGDRVPSLRGARLYSSPSRTVALEGEAARFPTEAVPFPERMLPDAPWTLELRFEDLNASFMGNVRLLVNTEHVAGRMLLDGATARQVSSLAMADIIRLLVASVASEDLRDAHVAEGSVGQVLQTMCRFFLGHALEEAIQLYRQDPCMFDAILHDRMRPLAEMLA